MGKLLFALALALSALGCDDTSQQPAPVADPPAVASTPPPAAAEHTPDALDKMVVVFDGAYSREVIKARLDRVMTEYNTPITEENYMHCGDVLVALKHANGTTEMDVLDYMDRSYDDTMAKMHMSFPSMAGISSAALHAGDH